MDNLSFKKVYEDNNLIELQISAVSKYVSIFQDCYVDDAKIISIANGIQEYVDNHSSDERYFEFGNKEGNYTPAFSMTIIPMDKTGHMKIEVDFEIADNNVRAHRCSFYITSELGALEKLGKGLKCIVNEKVGYQTELFSKF